MEESKMIGCAIRRFEIPGVHVNCQFLYLRPSLCGVWQSPKPWHRAKVENASRVDGKKGQCCKIYQRRSLHCDPEAYECIVNGAPAISLCGLLSRTRDLQMLY